MDLLLMILINIWNTFISILIPVEFKGTTYIITLFTIFIFTSFTSIFITIIANALD